MAVVAWHISQTILGEDPENANCLFILHVYLLVSYILLRSNANCLFILHVYLLVSYTFC